MINRNMVLLFAAFLFFSKMVAAQSVWTPEYQQQVYNRVYNSIGISFDNDTVKKQFSNCLVEKLKTALPAGISSVPSDSLSKLVNNMLVACRTELNLSALRRWSPQFEQLFRNYLYSRLKKALSENLKNSLCDCMIKQYKLIYPDGMPKEVSSDMEKRVLGDCYLQMGKKI